MAIGIFIILFQALIIYICAVLKAQDSENALLEEYEAKAQDEYVKIWKQKHKRTK